MAIVKMKDLLESGVHFGSLTSRWNPKMKPFIYGKRSNIHIMDMRTTLRGLIRAFKFLEKVTGEGENVVFVGTKRQAQEIIRSEANRAKQFFVASRWLGGTLTNLRTIRERVIRLDELEALEGTGAINNFSKKMVSQINREKRKISRNFEGIREMKKIPGAMVIIDPKNEQIALAEAIKLDIPVIALVDSDSDPEPIDFVIPGNDDGIRSIQIVLSVLANGCVSGCEKRNENAMLEARKSADLGPATIDPKVGSVSFGGGDTE